MLNGLLAIPNETMQRVFFSACLLWMIPVAASASFSEGKRYLEQEQYQAAVEEFRKAIDEDPGSAESYYYLGLGLSGAGDHAGAVASFKQALRIHPDLVFIHVNLGVAYYRLRLYELALPSLRKALVARPDDASAVFFTGMALQGKREYAESIRHFRRAAQLDPDFLQLAQLQQGISYRQLGDPGQANALFEQAIATDPHSGIADHARGILRQPATAVEKAGKWRFSVSAGIEYDDNVTTDELDQSTHRGDQAAILEFSAGYRAIQSEALELELAYDLYQSLYDDLGAFDLQSHTLSAYGAWNFTTSDAGLSYSYGHTSLGGDRLMESHSLSPAYGFNGLPGWYHRLSYGYQHKNFFNSHERDAVQHAVSADNYYFLMDGRAYVSLGLRLEDEDTSAPEFDYFGTYVDLAVALPLRLWDPTPKLKASYQYFWKDYDNVTPGIGRRRDDERETLTLELSQPVMDAVSVRLSYQAIDAASNLNSSDFIEHVSSLSVQMDF